jgi:hypothetical protein
MNYLAITRLPDTVKEAIFAPQGCVVIVFVPGDAE